MGFKIGRKDTVSDYRLGFDNLTTNGILKREFI